MSDKKIAELQLEIARLKKINSTLTKRVNSLDISGNNSVSPIRTVEQAQQTTESHSCAFDEFSSKAKHFEHIPMNGVMGMLELLLNSPADDKADNLADASSYPETSLLTVINDILDFSKIKSGKLSLNTTVFDLSSLLDDVVAHVSKDIQKKNLELITYFPEEIEHKVLTDVVRLRQILLNILDNAIKFTEQGEIEFRVEVEINDTNVKLNVSIRDTGKGIDPACQETIFEPFEQEPGANTVRDYSGTGLGLSITRDLIQLMGGDIALHSVPGEGSTFTFSIDLDIADGAEIPSIETEVRILLAEDTLANQEIMYEQMELLGYKIEIVENGLQALEAINQHVYALIFMDIHMPYMDGFAAAEAIRTVEREQNRQPVPIIAVTADLSKEVQIRCKNSGMDAYLGKPFSISDIEGILDTWLDNNTQNKPASQLPILSSTKDLSRAVIEQLRALSANCDSDTLGNAVNHLNLAYTILFTLQNTRNANALWQHQQLLEAAEHTAQVSHWSWEPGKQHIQFSRHLQRYFESPLCDIETLDDFIESIGDDDMNEAIKSCIANGHDSSWEQEIVNPGAGEPRYLLHRFRIVSGENKTPMLIGTVQEISSIRRAEQRIMELAFYDSLTKLSSRTSFNKQLQDLITSAHRRSESFAVLSLDLDDFKNINDSFGHDVGDKLLIEVANRLRNLLRESDFASRLGGDEFCMLINDIKDENAAENVARRCLSLLAQPFILAGREIIPHASIGIAIYPEDGSDANVLIKAADTAMYEAKKAGKKQYMLYETAMTDAAHHRLTIEDDLRTALSEKQFELYYQPKISLSSGKTQSVEALIRWHHPDNSLRAPDTFIPDAESLGLITELGEWVVAEACEQIKTWKQQGLDDISVAVNISPQHFEETNFAVEIAKIVKKSGISPSLIEIEITESSSHNQRVFLNTCQQLRKLGFRTAIDDFGTGYSSLSVLKGASVDVLKIYRVFI